MAIRTWLALEYEKKDNQILNEGPASSMLHTSTINLTLACAGANSSLQYPHQVDLPAGCS
jgi:hypothetical protein